jgi:hypothetical protein
VVVLQQPSEYSTGQEFSHLTVETRRVSVNHCFAVRIVLQQPSEHSTGQKFSHLTVKTREVSVNHYRVTSPLMTHLLSAVFKGVVMLSQSSINFRQELIMQTIKVSTIGLLIYLLSAGNILATPSDTFSTQSDSLSNLTNRLMIPDKAPPCINPI